MKRELEDLYEDKLVKSNWKTNLKAYIWDERTVPLQTYATMVKRQVDKFESELADVPLAKKAQYYLRFVSGLPDDYVQQVRMAMPSKKADIDRALDVCIRYQGVKEGPKPTNVELGGAASFQSNSERARLSKAELDIAKMGTKLRKLESRWLDNVGDNEDYLSTEDA